MNHCLKLLWLKEHVFLLSDSSIDTALMLYISFSPSLKDHTSSVFIYLGLYPFSRHSGAIVLFCPPEGSTRLKPMDLLSI